MGGKFIRPVVIQRIWHDIRRKQQRCLFILWWMLRNMLPPKLYIFTWHLQHQSSSIIRMFKPIIQKKGRCLYAKFITYKIYVQVSYSIYTKISKKNNILQVERRYTMNNKRIMQVERSRNNRRIYDGIYYCLFHRDIVYQVLWDI